MSNNEHEDKGFKISDRRTLNEEGRARDHEDETRETKQSKVEREAVQAEEQAAQQNQVPLPEVNFISLIYSLSTSVLVHLGLVPDPSSNLTKKDLAQAKQTIDLLTMLQEKTKGNLTKEEEGFLKEVLYDLRLKYVEGSKK